MVCQSQPSSTATSFTVRPQRPTCSVAHRPARSVMTRRAAATVGASSVHEPVSQSSFGHDHRCLRHTSRQGRPNAGRSTSSTTGRSLIATAPPQPPQTGRCALVSMCTHNGPPTSSTIPSTVTAGSPTSSSHTRVGSVHFHRGSPDLDGLDTIKFAEPLLRAGDGQTPLISEVPEKCPAATSTGGDAWA